MPSDFPHDLERKANAFHGKHEASLGELFSPAFMRNHTSFATFSAFLEAGGFHEEEFDAIPDEAFDAHIAAKTRFRNFDEMLEEAAQEYALKQLGL